MQIESAHGRHGPHFLGKHPERDHYKNVGTVPAQSIQKFRITQFSGLQHGYAMLEGILLYSRRYHLVSASGRFIGGSDHCGHLMSGFYYRIKARHGKFRGAEKDYPKFLHTVYFQLLICDSSTCHNLSAAGSGAVRDNGSPLTGWTNSI